MMEKPYTDGPLPEGVAARVEMARSAYIWLPDIEAYLVERGLTTELAPTVCALIDAAEQGKFLRLGIASLSLTDAVDQLALVLREQSS